MPKKKKAEEQKAEEKKTEETKKDEILDRSPSQFSRKFQSILYSEPKHVATIGFYLIFLTAIVIGAWSFFSIVNKSYLLRGEIIHLNPDISIQLSTPFEFKRHSARIGQEIKKGDVLFEYYDAQKKIIPYYSPVTGLVSQKIDLKQGVTYPPTTEVMTIRPGDKEVGVRLYVPENILNKVKTDNKIIYHFNFSFGAKNEMIEGAVLTEPVLDKDQYVVEAKINDESLKFLDEQKVTLINGMIVTAEIVVGQERLLSRFLGVKL
jgi:hypothetical protein